MSANGWLPPPRPMYVPPSYDPNDTDNMTRWKILLDWAHDDDMTNWLKNQGSGILWEFGGAPARGGNLTNFPTDTLIAFYFLGRDPSSDQLADFCRTYGMFLDWTVAWATAPNPGGLQQIVFAGQTYSIPASLPPDWQAVWDSLDQVITNTVIPKRANLGPLPANNFLADPDQLSDPITIYYYDDVWLKRISYPLLLVSAAATQDRWWAVSVGNTGVKVEQFASGDTDLLGNRGPTYSTDPNGVWIDEGFDFARNSGAFFDVLHAVVAFIVTILSVSGVGAVLAAFIGAVAAIAVDLFQAAVDSLNGGNPGAALVNMGDAILSVGSAELGPLTKGSPALAKLGKVGIQQLGTLLRSVGVDVTPPHQTLNLSDALALLQSKAPYYNAAMTLEHFNALLAFISGNSAAVPLAQAGWDTAQYASNDDIVGVGKVYEQSFPGPAAALWKMGAQLGALAKAQAAAGGVVRFSLGSAMTKLPAHVPIPPPDPSKDLMNYVRFTLAPRYHIPS